MFTGEATPLERYGHNLTALAQKGAFAPLVGYEAVVERVFQVLQRRNKCNPAIVGADSNMRWRVVAEVVRRMAVGDAPDMLCTKQVIALDYEALFANLPDDALEREERMREYAKRVIQPLHERLARTDPDSDESWAILDELFRWPDVEDWIAPSAALERLQSMFIAMRRASGSYLLFVDSFHRLVGGEWEKYPIDAATLLKPTLARGQVQLIGACTIEQYSSYIERDAALQRRFQEIGLHKVELSSALL